MKNKFLKVIALCTCITFTVTTMLSTLVFAGSNENLVSSVSKQEFQKMKSIQEKNDIAIAKLNPYVKMSKDGKLTITAPNSVINSIDKTTYNQLMSGLANTNSMIKNGDLKVDANLKLKPSNQLIEKMAVYSAGNRVGSEFYWWGFYLYFSSTMCNQAKASYAALGAVLSVYTQAFLGAGLGKGVSVIIQGALWAAAWIFDYYNSAGKGIKVRFTFCPVPVFTGAWSQ